MFFRSNLNFGLFRAWFWFHIIFWVRAYISGFGLVELFSTLAKASKFLTYEYPLFSKSVATKAKVTI